mgnify:CR=1 FL=1
MDWYVVQPYSGYELKVKAALEERIALANLKSQFGEILIPTEQVVELKSGAKKKTERKFFPGYILIEMEMNDETWHLVKETHRVLGFIGGTKNNPKPISDAEAAKILNQMEHGIEETSQGTVYEPGEMIRVIDGPFNDFSGVVEEADNQKGKVKVAVMIFGRSTPVELDFSQIERG